MLDLTLTYKDGFGISSSAKASLISGRTTMEFKIFGWQIEFGVSGDLGSIGGELKAGIFSEEGFIIKANASLGIGGGFIFRVKP